MLSTETSLMIIAISVLLLVIFAIITCVFLIQLLYVLKKTTHSVELKVNPLLDEARKIANITSNTTELIKQNIELTTPLFQSIGKISTFMEKIPNHLRNDMHDNTMNVNFGSSKGNNVGAWAEWVALSVMLIQRMRHK